MAFTGKENHSISSSDAQRLRSNHKKSHPNQVEGFFFGRDLIDDILKQDGCKGVRVYYAEEDDGSPKLVLVGADANMKDIPIVMGEWGLPCPPHC